MSTRSPHIGTTGALIAVNADKFVGDADEGEVDFCAFA
jgi:hypothetical protein